MGEQNRFFHSLLSGNNRILHLGGRECRKNELGRKVFQEVTWENKIRCKQVKL